MLLEVTNTTSGVSDAVKNYVLAGASIGLLAIVWWGFQFTANKIVNTLESLLDHKAKSEVTMGVLTNENEIHKENIADLYKKQYEHLDRITQIEKLQSKQGSLVDTNSEKYIELSMDFKEHLKEFKEMRKEHDRCLKLK